MITVPAIYENGVFRPLEKVDLPESSRVSVVLPDEPVPIIPPGIRPTLAAVYPVLSQRYESGHHDTAERHHEHQP